MGRAHLCHMPATDMASKTILAKNLETVLVLLLANLAGVLAQEENKQIPFQEQIYILAGVFGGACVLLILAVIALAVCVVKLKNGVRKAELGGNRRQAPPQHHNPPPSIPDMTAKVNHGYLPDMPLPHGTGQGQGYEHDLEPAQPPRPRYGEELPYGRAGTSQGYAPSSQGGQTTQFGSQFSWEPLPRVGGRGQQGRY